MQSRVTPFGELVATAARGTMYGNRGGRFHHDDKTLGARRWASRQWICCVLSFKGRHHEVWGRRYTGLFFLDEVTAFAAGHRPCFECRRAAATAFAETWAQTKACGFPYVDAMDRVLHAERLDGRAKRTHVMSVADLPDGAMIAREGVPFAVRGARLLRWSESGYTQRVAREAGMADVLTPPSTVAILRAGYAPQWHPSAD